MTCLCGTVLADPATMLWHRMGCDRYEVRIEPPMLVRKGKRIVGELRTPWGWGRWFLMFLWLVSAAVTLWLVGRFVWVN